MLDKHKNKNGRAWQDLTLFGVAEFLDVHRGIKRKCMHKKDKKFIVGFDVCTNRDFISRNHFVR